MMIKTNFALPVRKTLLALFSISIFMSILGIVFIYRLETERRTLIKENSSMKQIVAVFESKVSSFGINEKQSLSDAEMKLARNRIEYINNVTPIKSASSSQLLSTIEGLLPNGVRVQRLNYSALDGRFNLVAEANSADDIYIFLARLEQHSMFAEPQLQQRQKAGRARGEETLYEIYAVARKP